MAQQLDTRTEEELLVLKAQDGSKRAFAVLYKSYHPSLLRFSYGICKNEQMAADAVQDAWITIMRTLHNLYETSMFRARVFKAVRWRTLDLLRKQPSGHVPFDEHAEQIAVVASSPHATKGQLIWHIKQLPEGEQQAVYLFYLEELKLSEIAAVLEVPTGTVKSRLNRARARLREQMTTED